MTAARAPHPLKPLPVHLAHAQACWGGATPGLASMLVAGNKALLHPSLHQRYDQLMAQAKGVDRDQLIAAIAAGAQQRLGDLLAGIDRYLKHDFDAAEAPSEVIWQAGTTVLRDYGSEDGDAPILLMVPSLINPASVLDLLPGRSLVAAMRQRGLRPVVLDWQDPGPQECTFDIADYITRRLIPALAWLAEQQGAPVHVFGYCMGGTLSAAAAILRPDLVARLSLLAAPWDFHVSGGPVGQGSVLVGAHSELLLAGAPRDPISGDLVQMLFVSRDPSENDRKFRRFAHVDPASEQARFFVALERWANGCNALSRPAARACVADWYRDNKPATGGWMVDGKQLAAQDLAVPTLVIAPAADKLVPPECALALARQMLAAAGPATSLSPQAGHVGVVVGRARETTLWPELAQFHLGQKGSD